MSVRLQESIPHFLLPDAESPIGSYTFSEEKILDFAVQFDPQRFHVDAEAAKSSLLGGLCASGWHTIAVWMKLQRAWVAKETSVLKRNNLPWPEFGPSPGMKNVKWLKPVYVDQTIAYTNHIKGLRKSKSRNNWWIMANQARAENEDKERVMQFESTVFLQIHNLPV